ncbi:C45 family autoproteolytic acyltransferase/hydolase [Microbulbifer sp. Q7]|uniref:C45 family autoproteolytic acyltransferase/hydolase n=1 Tax=Microbulbifer sp. Q7 TaxID=1785091 RepID=UPI000B2DCB32
MPDNKMTLLNTLEGGKLYESNGFLIPVLTGSAREMGKQYGALMVDHMQQAFDVVVEPARKQGGLTQDEMQTWSDRAYHSCSTRNRHWYDGVAEGTGWPLTNVCMLDQIMEYGIFQSKLHSFAGCTSILSWGSHSLDGGTFIGRNMDWGEAFNQFAQVLTVRRPTDGAYKLAALGWPGMYCPFSVLNEHGVYLDIHDGTSMGGSLVYLDRPSILNVLNDILSESASLSALISRLNGICHSTSMILSIADEHGGASMECSSLAGNRLRTPDGDSIAVVNTFLVPDWGLGPRETISNSLRRHANMNARLAEHDGKVDAAVTRQIMDLRLFNEDGSFAENGGATKPTKQDADLTNHQIVTDVKRRQVWLKVPVPDYATDWTHIDLAALWK